MNNDATTAQPVVTTILGAAGYAGFGNAANISAADFGFGVDANASGGFQIGLNAGTSPDAILHSSLAGADGSNPAGYCDPITPPGVAPHDTRTRRQDPDPRRRP